MKQILIILVISIFCFNSLAQRTSDFKVGLGMPFITGNTTGTEVHTIKAIPSLSAEKPIVIKADRRNDIISVNPGISLFYLTEKEELGTETAGSIQKLNHLSANGYVKILYQQKLKRRSNAFVYFGGIAGAHIYTATNGEKTLFSQNDDLTYDEKVSTSGKDFYNTIYYGGLIGFEPNHKITNRYKTSFELSYLPNFITKAREKVHAVQLSVLIGINQ